MWLYAHKWQFCFALSWFADMTDCICTAIFFSKRNNHDKSFKQIVVFNTQIKVVIKINSNLKTNRQNKTGANIDTKSTHTKKLTQTNNKSYRPKLFRSSITVFAICLFKNLQSHFSIFRFTSVFRLGWKL